MLINILENSGIPYICENCSYRLQTGELLRQVMGNWFVGNTVVDEDWLLNYIGRQPVCISTSCMQMLEHYSNKRGVYCQVVDSKFMELCKTHPDSAVAIIGGVMLSGSLRVRAISTNEEVDFTGTIRDLVDYGRGVEE